MPLFDAIESDVTAFFVSQGTVFDALVKAIMDRMANVESSVALLRSDVTNNFNLVNQRIDASKVAAAEASAATAAAVASKVAAAEAAVVASAAASAALAPAAPVVTVVDPGGGRNDELEYYVMTLSRQLNLVLEVLFQPHGNNVVEVVQAKQMEMKSISDVLTENEVILMQLAAQHDDAKALHVDSVSVQDNGGVNQQEIGGDISKTTSSTPQVPAPESDSKQGPQALDKPREMPSTLTSGDVSVSASNAFGVKMSSQEQVETSKPILSTVDTGKPTHTPPSDQTSRENMRQVDPSPSSAAKSQSNQRPKQVVETISLQLDAAPLTKKEETVRTVSDTADNQSRTRMPDEPDTDDDEERDQVSIESPQFQSRGENALHRRKSFYDNCQDLQRQEEARLREQRRREEELMRRIHELLLQSRSQKQQEHKVHAMEEWKQQQNEMTQNQQTLIYHLQGQLQEQLQAHQQQEQEWRRQLEERRLSDVITFQRDIDQKLADVHHDVDRKIEAFNSILAAAKATESHEIAQAMQHFSDFESKFVSPDALEAAGALWLKTAADNCIYGTNPAKLAMLQQDLVEFKTQLNSYSVKSPAVSSLHEALDRAVQLLQQPAPQSNGMTKGSEQESTMYTLRQLLAKIDSFYRTAAAEHEEFPLPDVGFLAEVIHRMELGTANLLDAVDFQQEHFQQTSTQQQTGLDKLQKELWRQQEVEKALRTQLGTCPSKEDTLRLVQDLRDQITATTADSASRMLDTVDDLRFRMAGLPNAKMIEQLANDLHAKTDRLTHDLDTTAGKLTHDLRLKADRAEIDRLQSLLESSNGASAPPAYLTKSPLKCLSCDQHLPFAQAPHDDDRHPEQTSNPGSPTAQQAGSPPRSPPSSPPRPIIYQNQQNVQQPSYPYQQYPGYPQPGAYNDLGINTGILEELFAASTSALERRRQQRQRLKLQLLTPQSDTDNEWASRKPTFMNIDDGRNRIPLRKTQLSEQVIYGPAITPHAFRKKHFGRTDERPKTAALPDKRSGGEIITRTTSSTVIVRPFAELSDKHMQKR